MTETRSTNVTIEFVWAGLLDEEIKIINKALWESTLITEQMSLKTSPYKCCKCERVVNLMNTGNRCRLKVENSWKRYKEQSETEISIFRGQTARIRHVGINKNKNLLVH